MKEYLGDGVYIEHKDYDLVLTTSNGLVDTNTIVLDGEVLHALVEYLKREELIDP